MVDFKVPSQREFDELKEELELLYSYLKVRIETCYHNSNVNYDNPCTKCGGNSRRDRKTIVPDPES
jgi:hypothetical protein